MTEFQPLRMDRCQPCRVGPQDQHWQAAPQAPIRRWQLEREAPESGQVTSLVEYLPGARFPVHRHPAGEEILVLEGVFSDDSGNYAAGSYLRSPAGSEHAPFSEPGCLIFVKLNQFAGDDQATVRLPAGSANSVTFLYRCQRHVAASARLRADLVAGLRDRSRAALAGGLRW